MTAGNAMYDSDRVKTGGLTATINPRATLNRYLKRRKRFYERLPITDYQKKNMKKDRRISITCQ